MGHKCGLCGTINHCETHCNEDKENDGTFKESAGDDKVDEINKRSQFDLTTVVQLDHVWKERRPYKPDKAKIEFVEERDKRVVASLSLEDMYKRLKKLQASQVSNDGTAERAQNHMLQKNVLGQVHHFNEVKPAQGEISGLGRKMYLPNDFFRPKMGPNAGEELVSKGIIGYSEKPGWYAPGPTMVAQDVADHEPRAYCVKNKAIGLLRNLWLSVLLRQPTQLAFREKAKPGRAAGD